MGRIRVLDPEVVDRIAAGEVVERPASVVKELVENSLDAGAHRIDVRVEKGGRKTIEVEDDGAGMAPDDAPVAFVQHATSKIGTLEDLDRISTLGFRGEALASVAAVARVDLQTGTGEGRGVRVEVAGAKEPSVTAVASPRGTRIVVRDLFFNTPARRKHLRGAPAEYRAIAIAMQQFALLRPDVHFRLVHDGRERLEAAPTKRFSERVRQVLGAEVAEAWLPVDRERPGFRVHGGVTTPELTRANRQGIYLYVNRRAISDGRLAHAVTAAYDTMLAHRRYPLAALFIEVPVDEVDVNVHPRKIEVRFVEPSRAYGAILRAVQEALAKHLPPPDLRFGRPTPGSRLAGGVVAETAAAAPDAFERTPGCGALPLTGSSRSRLAAELVAGADGLEPAQHGRTVAGEADAETPTAAASDSETAAATVGAIPGTTGALVPLGQYRNTYILAQDDDGLLVVDQHVAHERILYEQVLRADAATTAVQRLLVPETLDLAPAEAAVAEAHVETMAGLGFEIEPFGGDTWAVHTAPELLQGRRIEMTVRALLETLGEDLEPEAMAEARRRAAASIACHAAVRANQPLSREVMTFLLEELGRCEAPARCPHGRPVLLRVDLEEIERRFHRR